MPDPPRYQTHGALATDSPVYVRRRADDELLEGVLEGDFCYVLAPRQVGKSSLRARTVEAACCAGIMVATANIQAGTDARSETEWYEGLIDQLVTSARDLNTGFTLPFEWGKWWDEARGPYAQRFVKLLREGFLAATEARWMITIDEIDASVSLPFTDSFFAAIRLCFDQRPEQPEFRRLSIVLLGAATPDQLIKDSSRTPFNIGRRIEMTDFTLAEAEPLAAPLPLAPLLRPAALAGALHWTGGQPHLTQVVCENLRRAWTNSPPPADDETAGHEVENSIKSTFFQAGILGDAHFAYITKRVRGFRRPQQLLRAYGKARSREGLRVAQRSTVAAELRIAGLVKPDDRGTLRVANPIYERVFNEQWIRDTTPVNWPVVASGIVMTAAALILVVGYFTFIPAAYTKQLQTAQADDPKNAFKILASLPGYRTRAHELYADFWERQAAKEEKVKGRPNLDGLSLTNILPEEGALIYHLRAFVVVASNTYRKEAEQILRERLAPLRATLRESNIVLAVAFSPDGKTVLTGTGDGNARFWSAESGQPRGKPLPKQDWINAVAFSPDGRTVLTGRRDGTAQLWDIQTRSPKLAPLVQRKWIRAVAFSPDGRMALTGSDDGTAQLWNTRNGKPIGAPLKQDLGILAVAFGPDGKISVTGGMDRTAVIWDTQTGQAKGKLSNAAIISGVAVSPDGKTILTGSWDGPARLWDVQNGEAKGVSFGHPNASDAVALSPNGNIVLTGGEDREVRLWDAQTGQPVGKPLQHNNWVETVTFSPDGRTLLTGSLDTTARLWDVATVQGQGERLEEALAGTPEQILERWLQRTALRFGENGVTLIPRFNRPEPAEIPAKAGH